MLLYSCTDLWLSWQLTENVSYWSSLSRSVSMNINKICHQGRHTCSYFIAEIPTGVISNSLQFRILTRNYTQKIFGQIMNKFWKHWNTLGCYLKFPKKLSVVLFISKGVEYTNKCLCYRCNKVSVIPCFLHYVDSSHILRLSRDTLTYSKLSSQ